MFVLLLFAGSQRMPPSARGSFPVAVGTSHITFLYLKLQRRQCNRRIGHCADVAPFLSSDMVEFKNYWIAQTTVDAWMSRQKVRDELPVNAALTTCAFLQCGPESGAVLTIVIGVRVMLA